MTTRLHMHVESLNKAIVSLQDKVLELNETLKLEMTKRAELASDIETLRNDYNAMVNNLTQKLGDMRQDIWGLQEKKANVLDLDAYKSGNQPCDTIHDRETEQDG